MMPKSVRQHLFAAFSIRIFAPSQEKLNATGGKCMAITFVKNAAPGQIMAAFGRCML